MVLSHSNRTSGQPTQRQGEAQGPRRSGNQTADSHGGQSEDFLIHFQSPSSSLQRRLLITVQTVASQANRSED